MVELVRVFLGWVAAQSGLTGAVILAAGLLYALYGLRMIRFLLVLSCGALGCLAGVPLAEHVKLPVFTVLPVVGVVAGIVALARPRWAIVLCTAVTWGGLGGYLSAGFGLHQRAAWVAIAVCSVSGFVLTALSRHTMGVLLTALHGSMLLVLGFVGVTTAIMPALGSTFRSWAIEQPLVVPVLLAMLTTMAYSIQAMHRQGDIRTGAQAVARL